jgi:hypothetical protein
VKFSGALGLAPSSEHDDVAARDVHCMIESSLWRLSAHSESRPNVGFSVENSDVIKVAVLKSLALVLSSLFEFLLAEVKSSLNHQVSSNENRAMAFSLAWSRSSAVRLRPSHDLKVENVHIIKELIAVPASEHEHLSSSNEIGSVIKPCCGSSSSLRTLVPCHGHRVESVKVSERLVLLSLSSKDNDPGACEDSGVAVPGGRGCPRDFRFNPS